MVQKTRLYYNKKSELYGKLVQQVQDFQDSYYPPFWLFTGHLQGPLGLLLRRQPKILYESETLPAKDGAKLLLKWALDSKKNSDNHVYESSSSKPVVLILPGLTGGIDKQYISQMVEECLQRRWKCVVVVFPGCLIEEDEINLCEVPRFYSPVDISDIKVIVTHIQARFPKSRIFGIGHSMGAALLVKFLASEGSNCGFSACVSISNPWNFCVILDHLSKSFINRFLYNRYFLNYWKRAISLNFEVFQRVKNLNVQHALEAKELLELDKRFTRYLYGFEDVWQYYSDCSCNEQELKAISTPLLIVHALDDPVVPHNALPLSILRNNKHCLIALTACGGHSGWLEGTFHCQGLSFSDRLCLSYLSYLLSRTTSSSVI